LNKILMVYPRMPETFWGFRSSLKFTGQKANFPPLGLLTVAAMIPDRFAVTLIDMNVEKLRDKAIQDSDLIFISAMIVQKESMEQVVSRCRSFGKTIVAGGPFVTSAATPTEGVDHFILGEAEAILPLFLVDWENGRPQKVYSSVERPDITKTPIPRFDLIDFKKYYSTTLQFSRGCPFRCEFCDIIELFGRTPRVKSPEQFVSELEVLYRLGYRRSIFIVDDNFIGNIVQVKNLVRRLIEWQQERGFPFSFFTEASVNLADDEELLQMMDQAGFTMVFLGIETPVEETLLMTQKAQNTKKDLLESIRTIQSAGIEVSAGFILGFDNDPDDIFDRQIAFIGDSGIPMAMVGLLTALPKTQLYKRLETEGRIRNESNGNNTFDAGLNYVPRMDRDRLISGYRRVLSTIYKPKAYFHRCWTLIKQLPHPHRSAPVNFQLVTESVSAFFKSLRKQGLSSYGATYFSYLLKVLFQKTEFFLQAMAFAILGHHFFRMTRLMNQEARAAVRLQARFARGLKELEERLRLLPTLHLKPLFKNAFRLATNWFVALDRAFTRLESSNADASPTLLSLGEACKTSLESCREAIAEQTRRLQVPDLSRLLRRLGAYKRRVLKRVTFEDSLRRDGALVKVQRAVVQVLSQAEELLIRRLSAANRG